MKYCLLFLSAILIISSCKKVDTPKSHDELLQDGKWRVDVSTVSYPLYRYPADVIPVRDTTLASGWADTMPACKADDYLIFRNNGNGGLRTGDIKCLNGEVDEIAFTWGLQNNNSKIYVYNAGNVFFGSDNVNADIKSFSDSKVELTFSNHVFVYNTQIGQFRDDTLKYNVTLKKF